MDALDEFCKESDGWVKSSSYWDGLDQLDRKKGSNASRLQGKINSKRSVRSKKPDNEPGLNPEMNIKKWNRMMAEVKAEDDRGEKRDNPTGKDLKSPLPVGSSRGGERFENCTPARDSKIKKASLPSTEESIPCGRNAIENDHGGLVEVFSTPRPYFSPPATKGPYFSPLTAKEKKSEKKRRFMTPGGVPLSPSPAQTPDDEPVYDDDAETEPEASEEDVSVSAGEPGAGLAVPVGRRSFEGKGSSPVSNDNKYSHDDEAGPEQSEEEGDISDDSLGPEKASPVECKALEGKRDSGLNFFRNLTLDLDGGTISFGVEDFSTEGKESKIRELQAEVFVPREGLRVRITKDGVHRGKVAIVQKYLKKKSKWGVKLETSGRKVAVEACGLESAENECDLGRNSESPEEKDGMDGVEQAMSNLNLAGTPRNEAENSQASPNDSPGSLRDFVVDDDDDDEILEEDEGSEYIPSEASEEKPSESESEDSVDVEAERKRGRRNVGRKSRRGARNNSEAINLVSPEVERKRRTPKPKNHKRNYIASPSSQERDSDSEDDLIGGGRREMKNNADVRRDGEWSCMSCTYLNSPNAKSCEMCQTARSVAKNFDIHVVPTPAKTPARPVQHFENVVVERDDEPRNLGKLFEELTVDDSDENDENNPKFNIPRIKKTGKNILKKSNRDRLSREYFQEFNECVFGGKLPDIEISWSQRMTSTAGTTSFIKKGGKHAAAIILGSKVVDTKHKLRSTLIHEMCHAACWIIQKVGRPPHGREFKEWGRHAQKCTGLQVSTCHNYDIYFKFRYQCTMCHNEIGRHSDSFDTKKYHCRCGGKIMKLGKFNRDGTPAKPRKISAWQKFLKENMQVFRRKNPQMSQREIMKALGAQYAQKKQAKQFR